MARIILGPESTSPSASFWAGDNMVRSPLADRYFAEANDVDGSQTSYDDARLFNRAFGDLVAAGGGEVELLAATYRLDYTLAPPDGTVLRGQGHRSILRPRGTINALTLADMDSFTLADIKIDGNDLAQPRLGTFAQRGAVGMTKVPVFDSHTLVAGVDVYIGDPEGRAGTFETNQIASVTAETVTFVNPLSIAPGQYTVISEVAAGIGGNAVKATNVRKLTFKNVHFYRPLRHCVDLRQVEEVEFDGCTFDQFGYWLVQADPMAARTFGIGSYDVRKFRAVNNVFKDSLGRRTAGIEVRCSPRAIATPTPIPSRDWIIQSNHFENLGKPQRWNANGAGVNLVCNRSDSDLSRMIVQGNTAYAITDGFFWLTSPGGKVVCNDNVCEKSYRGPMINVNAPMMEVVGNTCVDGGYSGIHLESGNSGDFGANPQQGPGYIDNYQLVVVGNVVRNLRRGEAGAGIIIDLFNLRPPRSKSLRQIVVHSNTVNGVNSDGVQLRSIFRDFSIQGNTIIDANAGTLADSQATADVAALQRQVTIAAVLVPPTPNDELTNYADNATINAFSDGMFVQVGNVVPDPTSLAVAAAVGDTSITVVSGAAITDERAMQIGTSTDADAEVVHVDSVVGNVVTFHPALTRAHTALPATTVFTKVQFFIESVDDDTHLTLEFAPGVISGAMANQHIFNPFPGAGAINLVGAFTGTAIHNLTKDAWAWMDEDTTAPAAAGPSTIRVHGVQARLAWESGDSIVIGTEARTISTAPRVLRYNVFEIDLNSQLNLAHQTNYPFEHGLILNNRAGQERLGTTQYGVFINSGVKGPLVIDGNDFDGCIQGDVRDPGGVTMFQVTPYRAGMQSVEGTPGLLMQRDWLYDPDVAWGARIAGPGFGETVLRVSDLTGLGWVATDVIAVAGSGIGYAVSGAPTSNADATASVGLSRALLSDHPIGTLVTNSTTGTVAYLVKAAAVGDVSIEVDSAAGWANTNVLLITGETASALAESGAPGVGHATTWKITLVPALNVDIPNGAVITNSTRGNSATVTGLPVGATIFTLDTALADAPLALKAPVGTAAWIGMHNVPLSEIAGVSVAPVAAKRVTIAQGLKNKHWALDRFSIAALPQRRRLYGPTWDGSQGAYVEERYAPESNAWLTGPIRSSANVQQADWFMRNDQGGDIRLQPGGINGFIASRLGAFIPALLNAYDLGSATNTWRGLYLGGFLSWPIKATGAPVDADITALGATARDGMSMVALVGGSYYLYTRLGGAWVRLGAFA